MIVRVKRREEHFVVLETAPLRVGRLTLKARGLWALCMTFPDDWEFRPRHLASLCERDGEAAVRSAMRELQAMKLASFDQERKPDGTLGAGHWTIYENPRLQRMKPDGENRHAASSADSPDCSYPHAAEPDAAEPDAAEPDAAEPHAANRQLRNNEYTEYTTPRNMDKTQQQHVRARARGREPSALSEIVADAAAAFSDRGALREALIERGIDTDVAGQLVGQADAGVIEGLVARYDREGGHTPGWLVKAIREGWSAGGRNGQSGALLTYQDALRVFDGMGGRFDEHFEPVKRADGTTQFRRKEVVV